MKRRRITMDDWQRKAKKKADAKRKVTAAYKRSFVKLETGLSELLETLRTANLSKEETAVKVEWSVISGLTTARSEVSKARNNARVG